MFVNKIMTTNLLATGDLECVIQETWQQQKPARPNPRPCDRIPVAWKYVSVVGTIVIINLIYGNNIIKQIVFFQFKMLDNVFTYYGLISSFNFLRRREFINIHPLIKLDKSGSNFVQKIFVYKYNFHKNKRV